MNVLFVCHRLPYPPSRGGKIRPFNIIKHLTERGHNVTVASLARSPAEAEKGLDLRKHCAEVIVEQVGGGQALARMIARLPTAAPSSFGYFFSPALHRRIAETLQRKSFDLILVHCSSVASYVASASSVRKMLDFGDMDSQKWLLYAVHRGFPLSAGYWLEGRKLERTEKELAQQFDLCTCTTLAELQTLRELAPDRPTDWFPNGVDASFFAPDGDVYDPNKICFVGRMDYFPNQQAVLKFCREVLPLIQAQRPATRFSIVGAAPSRAIRALDGRSGISVSGTVADVRPLVRSAAMTVAPLVIARGTQNKLLESMAMGVPVVASAAAARGVDAEPGTDLLAADSSEDFAAAVLRILERPNERRRFAQAGRERVLSHHSWASSMERLDALVSRCVAGAHLPRTAPTNV